MQAEYCALGCEIFRNFTRECPGIEYSLDPESYGMMVAGECTEQCAWSKYPIGKWWFHTNFDEYFACLDKNKRDCDFWEIKSECAPMYEEVVWGCQLLSLVCCVIVLSRMYKDIHKGWLQQTLFLSLVHNFFQTCITEECFNVFAKHIVSKGTPKTVVAIVVKYIHIWFILGGLIWSIVAAFALLRITHANNHWLSCSLNSWKTRIAFIVLIEFLLLGMAILSIIARFLGWRAFFDGLSIAAIVVGCLGLVCYIILACRAARIKRLARAKEKQRKDLSPPSGKKSLLDLRLRRSRRTHVVIVSPFLLLIGVLVFTYVPFVLVYAFPLPRTRTSQLIAWTSLDLVGVWNLISMFITYLSKCRQRASNSFMRAWLRDGRLVEGKNSGSSNNNNNANMIVGCRFFSRSLNEPFWKVSMFTTQFGMSCCLDETMGSGSSGGSSSKNEEDEDCVVGDVEQSNQGELIRWTRRPRCPVANSLLVAGLPLEKFHLFVPLQLAQFFPDDMLVCLQHGFSFHANISPQEDEERRLQLQAVQDFEEASAMWRNLNEDRIVSTDEMTDQFEKAQLNWACEEAILKLKATIEVLLRWSRTPSNSVPPLTPESELLFPTTSREDKQIWTPLSPLFELPSPEASTPNSIPKTPSDIVPMDQDQLLVSVQRVETSEHMGLLQSNSMEPCVC